MKKLVTPFRVGLLVMVAGVILFGLMTFVKKGGMKEDEAITVHAFFRDASGLGKKSRVQIAGIPVGEILEIKLENMKARVTLRIRRDVGLRMDAGLSKRSESLLGDYMLDLVPGTLAAPVMPEDGEITRVIDAQGMEQIFGSLNQITADIQAVTGSLRGVLGGEKGQDSLESIVKNLVSLTASVEGTVSASSERLDQILRNVEAVSTDVRKLTAREQGNISDIVANIEAVTSDVKDVMATVKRVVGENEGEVAGQVSNLKETLARLDRSLANIEEVTQNVKDGKGAVGALVSNERLGQRLSETVEDVADYAGKLTNLELEVGIKSEYLYNQSSAKNALQLRFVPKPDKYYLLEVVDDPRGSVETSYIQQNPPNAGAAGGAEADHHQGRGEDQRPVRQALQLPHLALRPHRVDRRRGRRRQRAHPLLLLLALAGGRAGAEGRRLQLLGGVAQVPPPPRHPAVDALRTRVLHGRRRRRAQRPQPRLAHQPPHQRARRLFGRRHLLHRLRSQVAAAGAAEVLKLTGPGASCAAARRARVPA